MTRVARSLVLFFLAAGASRCGLPPEQLSPSMAPLSIEEDAQVEDELDLHYTVRCGESINVYRRTSESAEGYSQSSAKRVCRAKLVRKINKGTRCDRSRCGGGSCRPDSDVRWPRYECSESSSGRWRCTCRPTTIMYACTSCAG